ncbi:hypothetical protein [Deinococcus radiophilus]|uniref:hypothetical protein n=1 Tax=Deinococcus radiophilus TaxID=32062 RepID=UPI00361AACBE
MTTRRDFLKYGAQLIGTAAAFGSGLTLLTRRQARLGKRLAAALSVWLPIRLHVRPMSWATW